MALNIFLLIIIAIVVAMLWNEGIWSNLLSWINALFSAMIASNLFEPAATFLDKQAPSLTYFWDFLMIWAIFALSFLVLRVATDQISETRVRFKLPIELGGRALFGFLTGWTVVCLATFSLHTAPTVRSSFRKSFQEAPMSTNFFVGPDRLWLGFLQSRSEGALQTSSKNVFDPQSEFVLKYGERRKRFSEIPSMAVNARMR